MSTMYVQLLLTLPTTRWSYMVVKDDFHYSEMVALRGGVTKGIFKGLPV